MENLKQLNGMAQKQKVKVETIDFSQSIPHQAAIKLKILSTMKSLNSFLPLIILTCLFACSGKGNVGHSNKDNMVRVNKQDTIINDSMVLLRTELLLDSKKIVLSNCFKCNKKLDTNCDFNLNNYLGLTLQYKNITIDKFESFSPSLCKNSYFPFFEVFKGDSIDNPNGFNYIDLINQKTEYIVLKGYFLNCNGSFCNNGVLLIMGFQDDTLQKAYLIGIDRTMLNLSKINGSISDNSLQLDIDNFNDKNVSLIFKEGIDFTTNAPGQITEVGLFCISR